MAGCADKIGKADAEKDFHEKIVPVTQVFVAERCIREAELTVFEEPHGLVPSGDDTKILHPRTLSCYGQSNPLTQFPGV